MKIATPMIKQFFTFVAAIFCLVSESSAQNNGIIPLTGLRYFKEGINVSNIDVKIDGAQLLNNKLPLGKEIAINLEAPLGFTEEGNKVFAGAEFSIISPKGEVLMKNPNIFARYEATGFSVKDFKTVSVRFGISPEVMKTNIAGTIKIRLFDLKGKNQIRVEMPMTIAKPGEIVQLSQTVKSIKSVDGLAGMITGIKAKGVVVTVDTTIQVAPKMAYTSLDISNIEGSSIAGIFKGKESFWVYDADLNEVKITDILLKQVKGAMENDNVDYTLKIPYRLKKSAVKLYTVRFRWESPDKRQVIDVVVNI